MSQSITWATAQTMAADYQNSSQALRNASNQVLKGFSVDANHIKAILGLQGVPTVPTLFIIMGFNGSGEFSPVITAVDSANNITTNNVYDACLPCPTTCPTNF